MLTFGSLFAGIGGLDLGLERAGMVCKWQVEIDDHCNKMLEKHWSDVRRYGDVRECGRHNLEPVDLVCGGVPCQDVSVAGRRAGLAGKRTGLWFEFHRVLAELRPRWVVFENVPGLLSSKRGRDFATILRGLAKLGYLSAWRILDAQYFGVAQRRRRVFIVGHLGDGRAAEVLFEPTCGSRDTPPSRQTGAGVAKHTTYCIDQGGGKGMSRFLSEQAPALTESMTAHAVSRTYNIQQNDGGEHRRKDRPDGGMYVKETDTALTVGTTDKTVVLGFDKSRGTVSGDVAAPLRCNSAQSPGVNDGKADNQCVLTVGTLTPNTGPKGHDAGNFLSNQGVDAGYVQPTQYGVRRLTPVECERLQGFPDGWTAEGQSDSKRYKQLGNAVCVPVSEWIGRRIVAASG